MLNGKLRHQFLDVIELEKTFASLTKVRVLFNLDNCHIILPEKLGKRLLISKLKKTHTLYFGLWHWKSSWKFNRRFGYWDIGDRNTFRCFSVRSLVTGSVYFAFTHVLERRKKTEPKSDPKLNIASITYEITKKTEKVAKRDS